MGVEKKHSISIFITKVVWIIFLIFQESNLVICGDLDDDSLQNALEAIERRQRNLQLQENDYYGQPENIGYGFQKNFGFFENGPARELGSPDADIGTETDLQNILSNYLSYQKDSDYDNGFDKRKSNFRERFSNIPSYLISEKENTEGYGGDDGIEYLQLLKNLWSKYRTSHPDGVLDVEDLTDDQVQEILNPLYEKGMNNDEEYGNPEMIRQFDAIPLRNRRNYRVFEHLNERRKRYPGFGEGIYGKRNSHSQHVSYEPPPENDFLYALKFVNPDVNREAVETLKEGGFEVLGDERDKDILRALNGGVARPKYSDEEPFWLKDQSENEIWLPEPVSYPEENYPDFDKDEKRSKIFKQHNGLHLNRKRFPVKRSPGIRVRKEVSKEIKNIFETTTPPPKKKTEKKPTEMKPKNVTKPEITKHHEIKKVVRRAQPYTKEEIYPPIRNDEINNLFKVKKAEKKSIDWSQYFGINKRSQQNWLREDARRRAESHFLNNKRYSNERTNVGNINFLDKSQYEIPFDTRIFNNRKRFSYDIGSNIDNMESKIGNIEERIIDDTVKFTGAHSGKTGEDKDRVKNEVIHRLKAAYSLEKMKNALSDFKNSIKPEDKKTGTESPKVEALTPTAQKEVSKTEKPETPSKKEVDKNKRVAVKKEGVEDLYGQDRSNADSLEFLNWPSQSDNGFSNNQFENDECPVLDKILHNCLRVEEIGGRYAELLLPICSLQQICYICGSELGFSRPSSCDLMFLTEAQNLCQGDKECLLNSRDTMLALRDLHDQDMVNESTRQFLSGSCFSNSCIQRYFLNTPGAVVPLEFQK